MRSLTSGRSSSASAASARSSPSASKQSLFSDGLGCGDVALAKTSHEIAIKAFAVRFARHEFRLPLRKLSLTCRRSVRVPRGERGGNEQSFHLTTKKSPTRNFAIDCSGGSIREEVKTPSDAGELGA
jgi:hypothetical protein